MNGLLTIRGGNLSKSGEKSFPFFQVLLENEKFEWTLHCKEVFQSLNNKLKALYLLTKLVLSNDLSFYLSINLIVVTSVLVKKKKVRENLSLLCKHAFHES